MTDTDEWGVATGSRSATAMPETPSPYSADAEERDLLEHLAEQVRLHRRGSRRRARIIARFLHDPGTIRQAARADPAEALAPSIPLPRKGLPPISVEAVFTARRSTPRSSLERSVDLADLGAVLQHAVANQHEVRSTAAPDVTIPRRAYPSAGALFPIRVHVWPSAVEGLEPRPYAYDPHGHRLVDRGCAAGRFSAVEPAQLTADALSPAVALILTCRSEVVRRKYGVRGLRLAWLEAGHLGQALILVATALGLPSLVYASFHDAELDRALLLDGLSETVVSSVLLGGRAS